MKQSYPRTDLAAFRGRGAKSGIQLIHIDFSRKRIAYGWYPSLRQVAKSASCSVVQ
jgi:hypothetical protein